jgi:hypothetical protein
LVLLDAEHLHAGPLEQKVEEGPRQVRVVNACDDDVGIRRVRQLVQLVERCRMTDDGHIVLARHGSLDHVPDEPGEADEEDADLLNSG